MSLKCICGWQPRKDSKRPDSSLQMHQRRCKAYANLAVKTLKEVSSEVLSFDEIRETVMLLIKRIWPKMVTASCCFCGFPFFWEPGCQTNELWCASCLNSNIISTAGEGKWRVEGKVNPNTLRLQMERNLDEAE